MNTQTGKRTQRNPRITAPEPITILGEDVLETIHDWEDVDGDYLREACRSGETLSVDE